MALVRCPHCGKETVFSKQNPFRPFCSERCQLIDLGNWADGRYAIPDAEESSPTQEEEGTHHDDTGESADDRTLH